MSQGENRLFVVIWLFTVIFSVGGSLGIALLAGKSGVEAATSDVSLQSTQATGSPHSTVAVVAGNGINNSNSKEGMALLESSGCMACHRVDSKLVGPAFKDVAAKYASDAAAQGSLSEKVMKGGSGVWGEIPMPPNAMLKSEDAQKLVSFVLSLVSAGQAPAAGEGKPPEKPSFVFTEADRVRGQNLFQGKTRFAKGGPACISCHDVNHDAIIGGGILALELTQVFSKLGGEGVSAIIGSPPFPVMQEAYWNRALEPAEVTSLVAFLQQADKENKLHQPLDYGFGLFFAGCLGTAVLLGIYGMMWSGRKRGSVNQEIYDRQIKSE